MYYYYLPAHTHTHIFSCRRKNLIILCTFSERTAKWASEMGREVLWTSNEKVCVVHFQVCLYIHLSCSTIPNVALLLFSPSALSSSTTVYGWLLKSEKWKSIFSFI
jgi:hypothetical protein